jgi:hypothetical protein
MTMKRLILPALLLALASDARAQGYMRVWLQIPTANGMVAHTGNGAAIARTITASAGGTCTNGDGVSGNPTCGPDLATTPQFTSGTASPPATCNLGEIYLETDALRACNCSTTNTWTCNGKLRAHATDCTSLTDGIADEMCFERDADTVYVCEPSAGGCDTAGEWKIISGGSGAPTDAEYIVAELNGSLSAEVAPSAANQVPVSSSSTAAAWGTVPTAAIADGAVTYAKMQDVSAASKLLGRGDSGSGDPQEITLGSGMAMTGTTLSVSGGDSFQYLSSALTSVGNVGTGEDTLHTYTVTAGKLAADGDSVLLQTSGQTASATGQIRAKFGATTIVDTGAISFSGRDWILTCRVIRTSATTQRSDCAIVADGLIWIAQYATPGETLSGTVAFTVTGEATSNDDIVARASIWNFVSSVGTSPTPINLATSVTGTLPVANGGTGLTAGTSGGVPTYTASGALTSSAALTANLPVIGGGAGAVVAVGTRSGNTTAYVTTTGTQTSGDCVKIDANGNHIANGSACGGSGTPGGANTQVQFNNASAFGGDADMTFVTDTLTVTKVVVPTSATINADGVIAIGTNGGSISQQTAGTPDQSGLWTGTLGNAWHIAENADKAFDFALAAQTDPTLYLHSHNQATAEYLSFFHNGSYGNIKTANGDNGLGFRPGTDSVIFFMNTSGMKTGSNLSIGFTNGSDDATATLDTRLTRAAAGVMAMGGLTTPTVASGTTITATSNVFHVSGTTTITSVTNAAAYANACIDIIFDGVLTFTDGSNLKLAGNFVTTADDAIRLCSDGTNWFEFGRSVN